jgi:hypothetical protein
MTLYYRIKELCIKLVIITNSLDTVHTQIHSTLCTHKFTRHCTHTNSLDTVHTQIHSTLYTHKFTRHCRHTNSLDTVHTQIHSTLYTHKCYFSTSDFLETAPNLPHFQTVDRNVSKKHCASIYRVEYQNNFFWIRICYALPKTSVTVYLWAQRDKRCRYLASSWQLFATRATSAVSSDCQSVTNDGFFFMKVGIIVVKNFPRFLCFLSTALSLFPKCTS